MANNINYLRNLISNSSGSGYTSLFDAMGKSGSKSSNAASNMLNYNLTSTKGYQSALKAYYKKNDSFVSSSDLQEIVNKAKAAKSGKAGNADAADKTNTDTAKTSRTTKYQSPDEIKLAEMRDSAIELRNSAETLGENTFWAPDQNGKYNLARIKEAVKSFVNDYNDAVEKAGTSTEIEILHNGVWMTDGTAKNENLLNKVGISIGKDNKLSFNEDAVKESNIANLKSVFSGRSSFGGRIAERATNFEHAANRALNNGTYNSAGKYSSGASSTLYSKLNKGI